MKNLHTHIKRCFAIFTGLMLTAGSIFASGFALYETSASSFSMANANMGRASDASAIYMNPAGITELEGTQVIVGASASKPYFSITSYDVPGPGNTTIRRVEEEMNDDIEVRPYMYVTQSLSDDLVLGVGFFMPYGAKTEYKPVWAQTPSAPHVYYSNMKVYNINPNLAYRIVSDKDWAKHLSLSVGVQILRSEHEMRVMRNGASIDMDGKDTSLGFNLGLQWELNDEWAFGVSYRSKVKQKFDDLKIDDGVTINPAYMNYNLPQTYSIGVNYTPSDQLNVGIQATRTCWSDYNATQVDVGGDTYYGQTEWKDRWNFSLGIEYLWTDWLTLRGGFMYDQDPVNKKHADFMEPMGDRKILTGGLGFTLTENLKLDVAYGYINAEQTKLLANASNNNVFTKANSGHYHVLSVSLGLKF